MNNYITIRYGLLTAVTESCITESGITESGITESGITESGIMESGITESGVRQWCRRVRGPSAETLGGRLRRR